LQPSPELAVFQLHESITSFNMPTTLVFKETRDYLEITLKNPRKKGTEVDTFADMWREFALQCRATDQVRVMARIQLRQKQSVESAYQIARAAIKGSWQREYKLALVARLEDHFYLTLLRDFMVHEGFEVDLFTSRRAARRWLLSE